MLGNKSRKSSSPRVEAVSVKAAEQAYSEIRDYSDKLEGINYKQREEIEQLKAEMLGLYRRLDSK